MSFPARMRWLAAAWVLAASVQAGPVTFYVAPFGNDHWSGGQPAANATHTDGPLATLTQALTRSRDARAKGAAPIQIILREGDYHLTAPLVFTPADSGLLVAAYRRERPVICGDAAITGWGRSSVNPNLWQAQAPGARGGGWTFHELFVNGARAQRPRLPRVGFYRVAGAVQGHPLQLHFHAGDIRPEWAGSGDAELVTLQAWAQTRNQLQEVREGTNVALLAGDALPNNFEENARFYIDNAAVALRPGQWRLDRASGVVTYRAVEGEDVARARITAPRLYDLARLEGRENSPVHDIVFRGLTFAGADWPLRGGSDVDIQAAVEVGAALEARFARRCAIEQCMFTRLGGYAVDFGHGCESNRVIGCEMQDLGGGGVRLGDSDAREAMEAPNFGNVVSDNHIHDIGVVSAPAVGVLVLLSASNLVAHNEIDHSFYSTISVGWSWGYAPNACRGNIIEWNHLHDYGQGMLSDMGGVYTLGVQPGTVVRENLIHDANVSVYGGWGLYTDEGSSGIVLESNIVYRCQSAGMHQHYGESNLFYNNIFALNRECELARTRAEPRRSFTFSNNIIYLSSGKVFGGNWGGAGIEMDHNLYFDTRTGPSHPPLDWVVDFAAWRRGGRDVHSAFFDPEFIAPEGGDFRLRPGGGGLRFGIHPLDLREAGPRRRFLRQ